MCVLVKGLHTLAWPGFQRVLAATDRLAVLRGALSLNLPCRSDSSDQTSMRRPLVSWMLNTCSAHPVILFLHTDRRWGVLQG